MLTFQQDSTKLAATTNISTNVSQTLIRKISTKKLFGFHTYEIDVPESPPGEASLLILYGDNGSGKTTILKILFHLLSYEPFGGHRSFIRRIRFEEIRVHLDNSLVVRAYRKTPKLDGEYHIEIKAGEQTLVNCTPLPNADRHEPKYLKYCKILRQNNIVFYYLGDNRALEKNVGNISAEEPDLSVILGSDLSDEHLVMQAHEREVAIAHWRNQTIHARRPSSDDSILDETIQNASEWIRQRALQASDTGTVQANSLYADVISHIVSSTGEVHTDFIYQEIRNLLTEINNLSALSKDYSRFGLQPEFDGTKLIATIEQAHTTTEQLVIHRVLKPYIDGIRVRLQALADIQQLIQTFVNHLNDFYKDKHISFDLQSGLTIVSTRTDDKLAPNTLSSGEKQLLLLLCNALTAREHAGIFIIDEPEISLNVKWQRKLLKALLDCMRGSRGLFIVASHSIELITPYKKHVQALVDKEESAAPR